MNKQSNEPSSPVKLKIARRGATVVGTGFFPLDLVYRDDDPSKLQAFAGGTCGNVLIILAFLGWDVYPVGRLNGSSISEMIKDDLKLWGVHLDFISLQPTVLPPVVVQKTFCKPKAGKTHSFAWTCPGCGAPLPSFKPVIAKSVWGISDLLPKAQVFFFDRVSRAAVDLAHKYAESGGVVVFEPSMIGDPKLFSEALRISHILKYSQDRISDVHEVRGTAEPLIEVETLGSAGLRYRRRGKSWREIEAFSIRRTVDTSGAGDWCTAGILHLLAQDGAHGLRDATDKETLNAMRLGQAMAAWICKFEGARGGMYGVSWSGWKGEIIDMLHNGQPPESLQPSSPRICPEVLLEVCCPGPDKSLNYGQSLQPTGAQVCATLRQGGGVGKALSQ